MADNGQKIHECYNCGELNKFYTKEFTCFKSAKCGFCYKHQTIKTDHETCDKWRSGYGGYYSIKIPTKRVLRELLSQLSVIRQILQEEQERGKK